MRFIFAPFFFIAATALAQAPVADFDWSPEDPAPGTSIEFSDRSAGATSSTFFLGMHGGTPFPGPVLQLSFANPGTYQIRLEATNAFGSSTKVRRVNVGVAATSSFTKSASTVNTGQVVQFTDQSSGLVRSWSWSFGDGTTVSEDNPQHAWTVPGTYTVTLEVRYTTGSLRTSQTVTVLPTATRPAANFTFTPPAPRRGDTVQFTDTSTGSPTSWSWSFGDGTTSTERSPSHVYAQAGTYSVALTASNSSGSDTATKTIGVTGDAGPKADFAFTDYPLVGQSVQFTDRSTGSPNGWSWTFGDGGTSTQQSPAHTFAAPGVYTVALAARNATGSDLTAERITVRSGQPIEADFETFPSQIVKGEPILFVNRSTGPVVSVTWTFPGGTTATGSSVTHTFPETGEPTIDLTVTDGVEMKKMMRRMTVREKARRAPIAHFAAPGSALLREVVNFENLSSSDATTFRWDFGDGSTDTGRTARHSYAQEGTYRVTLVARSSEGEEATATREIQIDDPNNVKADFSWSPPNPAEGMEVQFLNKSDGKAVEFLWSVVEHRSNERHTRYRFRNFGTFEVTLVATTASGVTSTIVKSVTVKPSTELVAKLECSSSNRFYVADFGKGECGSDWVVYRQYSCVAQVTGNPTTAEIRLNGVRYLEGGVSAVPRSVGVSVCGKNAPGDCIAREEGTLEFIAYRETDKAVAGQSVRLVGPSCTACDFRGLHPNSFSSFCGGDEETSLQADFIVQPAVPKVGEEVTLLDQSKGFPKSSRWTVGNNVLNGSAVKHRFLTAGPHLIRHEVSNGVDTDSVSRAIEVKGGAGPAFKKVTSRYGECYYNNHPVDIEVTAEMDWKDSTPVSAKFRINDGAEQPAEIDAALNIKLSLTSLELRTNGKSHRNVLSIVALNAAGMSSTYDLPLYAIDAGPLLRHPIRGRDSKRHTLTEVTKRPFIPWEGKVALPEIRESWKGQEIGLEKTQAIFQEVLATDCTFESSFTGMAGFVLPGFKIRGEVHGKHNLTVAPATGVTDQGGLVGVEIGGGHTGPEMSLLTWVPALQPFCLFPSVCDAIKVKEEVFLKAGLDVRFYAVKQETSPGVIEESWAFDDVDFLVKPEGKVAFSVKASKTFGVELSAGTSFQTKFKFARPPYFNGGELKFTGTGKFTFFVYQAEHQFTLTCTFAPTGGSWNCSSKGLLPLTTGGPTASAANRPPLALRPIPVAGEREHLAFKMRQRGDAIVATSLSKLAAPAATETGGSVVAAYVSENPSAANPLHRTDLRFVTRQDGAWSEPRAITADELGDFSPSLVKTSDGRIVALWQRIKNPSLRLEDVQTSADLPKLYRENEIVSSVYSAASGTWSAPVALTDNQVFDHDPIALALSDGRILALWLRDPGNELAGTPANPTQLVARTWNGIEWTAEAIVANGLTGVEGLHGSSRATSATAAFSRDKDGDPATGNDREIAVITYDNGTWGSLRDLTFDSLPDHAPRVIYGSDGARVLWIGGDGLVWQTFGGERQVIRPGSSGSLLNATVAAAPAGNLLVVWTESTAGSADIIIRSYDPATKVWSNDIPLTRNDAVESSLSAFFTPDGKLQVVGLETETKYVSETQIVDGQPVVFPNVPQPGAIQLLHLEKEIVVDAAIVPNTLTAGAGTPAAGETVTLTAELLNAGDLPVRDVPLLVYAGRGTSGEILARDKVSGDWNAGSTRQVEIAFPYSSKAEELTLAVDPLGESGDRLQANNTAVFSYRNAPPVACVQVNRMIGLAPLTVTLDASCSTDSDGRVVLTRWSLADGVAATGTVATHTFNFPGTYTVTATVIDDLARAGTSTVDIHVSSLGDPRTTRPANPPLILPVVGRTAGVGGTFFVSDATIFNGDADRDLVVQAMFFPDGRRDFHYSKLTVPPNRLLDLSDVVAKTFHASGIGWARFDLSHPSAAITSRTYNKQPAGTAGTFIPASTVADAVGPGLKRVFLQEWREGYRVNVGLTEVGGDGGMVSVSMYDENGALAGTNQYAIAPWQRLQINGEPLFQRKGRIEVTTDGGRILAFTATTDNKSGDPVYQAGVELTSLPPSARWLVPIVGRVRGAFDTDFRSDVRVFNAAQSTQNVRFILTLPDRALEKSVAVESGRTAAFDDIISGLFPELSGGAVGSLTIAAGGAIVVTAKAYNQTSKGTYGVATPPRQTDRLLAAGERGDLIQLRNDSAFRCNFGATAGPDGTELLIAAYNERGDLLGQMSLGVAPNRNIQIGRIFEALGVTTPLAAARLNVAVISGSAYVFATVVDNQTGDGTFVEAGK